MAGKNKTSNEKSSKTGDKKPKAANNKGKSNNEGDENSSSSKLKAATAINSRHILVWKPTYIIYLVYLLCAPPRTERKTKIEIICNIVRETFKKGRSSF